MRARYTGLAVAALFGIAAAQQQDTPVVETGGVQPDRLEDQPAVDDLPAWLIDIPPEEPTDPLQAADGEPLQYVAEDKHVVSQSRMFSVSGGDALRMGALATHADELLGHFNRMLGAKAGWKYAVSIRLLGTTADAARPNPIRTRLRIIDGEPNLQIRVYAGGGIDIAGLDAAIVAMLVYEYALRDVQPNALPDRLSIPPWLLTGVQQALLVRTGRIDRRIYENLLNKGDMMSPEQIINTPSPQTLDSASRRLYEVSCGVLISGLLHSDDGAERLRNLLAEAVTLEGGNAREIISTYFHEMNGSSDTFAKWWALELAALARPDAMEMLTPPETEKQLADALLFTAVDEESKLPLSLSLDKPEQLVKLPDLQRQLRNCMQQLQELNLRAFPGYRTVIAEYLRAATELANGSDPGQIAKILAPLQELRRAYTQASTRGRDYLDWFEITRLGQFRKADFEAYNDALRTLRAESDGPDTPISRYLRDIEELHDLPSGAELPPSLRPAKKNTQTKKRKSP